jgi:hypothetical protein
MQIGITRQSWEPDDEDFGWGLLLIISFAILIGCAAAGILWVKDQAHKLIAWIRSKWREAWDFRDED